jgi:hypothetical protein
MAPQTVLRSASEPQAFTALVIFSTRGIGFVFLLVDSVLYFVRTSNLRASVARKGQVLFLLLNSRNSPKLKSDLFG